MTRDEYYFDYLREMRENYRGWDGIRRSPYDFDRSANFPMSDGERNLWGDFRGKGIHMYYQFPIGKYYADFCDPHHGLVVEVDGKIHYGNERNDKIREDYIRSVGFDVLRISGRDTYDQKHETESSWGVVDVITKCAGYDKVVEWYERRGIETPHTAHKTPVMPWLLFKAWNESIKEPYSRELYDLHIAKHKYQDEVLTSAKHKEDFIEIYSFADMLTAIEKADEKYNPLIAEAKKRLSTPHAPLPTTKDV